MSRGTTLFLRGAFLALASEHSDAVTGAPERTYSAGVSPVCRSARWLRSRLKHRDPPCGGGEFEAARYRARTVSPALWSESAPLLLPFVASAYADWRVAEIVASASAKVKQKLDIP